MASSKYTCALQAYDLWTQYPVQDTVEETIITQHRPLAPVEFNKAIEFEVHTSLDEYILFNKSFFEQKIRIDLSRLDGEAVTSDDWKNISVVNQLLPSTISQLKLEIANNTIPDSQDTYPYKAYFENLLGFDDSAKKSHLTSILWSKDDSKNMDEPNIERSQYLRPTKIGKPGKGNVIQLIGKNNLDLTFQGRAFIGGSVFRLKYFHTKPEFFLMVKDLNLLPKVHLESAVLYISRARVNPAILQAHNAALKIRPAQYPMVTGVVKRAVLKKDTVDAIIENIILGPQPNRIFVAFVENKAFNGSFTKNPYNFKLFDISHLCFYRNGQSLPTIPFQPDVDNGHTLREYYSFMDAANQTGTSTYIDINRDEWNSGYGIFGVNFTPDLSDGCGMDGHVNHLKTGSTRLQVIFRKPLPTAVTVLMYCEFDTVLQIDQDRNPIVTYNNV